MQINGHLGKNYNVKRIRRLMGRLVYGQLFDAHDMLARLLRVVILSLIV